MSEGRNLGEEAVSVGLVLWSVLPGTARGPVSL